MSDKNGALTRRRPNWTRDELILALDFYLRHRSNIPVRSSEEVIELSRILNQLREQLGIHGEEEPQSANGVHKKLMNLKRIDPLHAGKEFQIGVKEDRVIWSLFANRPDELHTLSETVRQFAELESLDLSHQAGLDGEVECEEGKLLTRIHLTRERNPTIVEHKKACVLKKTGKLACEACNIDFAQAYGEFSNGYIGCHHNKPLSQMRPGDRTRLQDLSLVCSSCHHIIHRRRPWMTVEDVRHVIGQTKDQT